MTKIGAVIVAICFLILVAGCSGGNGSHYDGSEGRAYTQSQVQSANQQWAITGQGKYQAPGGVQ